MTAGDGAAERSTLDDAQRQLSQLPGLFFSSEAAVSHLKIDLRAARELLTEMERHERSVRVCRDGWVLTRDHGQGPRCPELAAYLSDMMNHLDVGYYLSYAAAARRYGASHHGVMRQHVNVEAESLVGLELREADGPDDLAVAFHRIEPQHGRPASEMSVSCLPSTGEGRPRSEQRTIRVGTTETVLLDMVERTDRCGGIQHVATIASKMLYWRLLDPVLLAEASDLYEPVVARRTGSMLQRIRRFRDRFSLRPLQRQVRSRSMQPTVELHGGKPDTSRTSDRWGVTCKTPLDPDR